MSPLLQENGRTPAAYLGDANSLFWNFISFPHKPSSSASFLHWIFLLSYPYSITLYISNWYLIKAIVSSSPMPSLLRVPWIHWVSSKDPFATGGVPHVFATGGVPHVGSGHPVMTVLIAVTLLLLLEGNPGILTGIHPVSRNNTNIHGIRISSCVYWGPTVFQASAKLFLYMPCICTHTHTHTHTHTFHWWGSWGTTHLGNSLEATQLARLKPRI